MRDYKKTLRIVTITLFLIIFCSRHVQAFDLDMTVDDDIRKNNNPARLVKDTNTEEFESLPDLPLNLQNEKKEIKTQKDYNIAPQTHISHAGNIKISKGTTFSVVNTTKVSDWQTKGSKVKFKTVSPIYKKKYTIPESTVFMGIIVESHQPQISCNGGLVVIKIESMVYKGQTIPVNAYITRANDKIIFFNNIKGERTYLKTLWKKGNWGRSMFGRMMSLTINLGRDGSTLILSPFPFLYGSICVGANTLISPITAFFNKGGHVSINTGSHFKIKLNDDVFID